MRITIPNFFPKETEAFVNSVSDDLSLFGSDIELHSMQDDRFGSFKGLNGGLVQLEENMYLALIRVEQRTVHHILFTIAHELMHVHQYMFHNLSECLAKPFDYNTCWWEKQANDYAWYALRTHHK